MTTIGEAVAKAQLIVKQKLNLYSLKLAMFLAS